MPADLTPSSSDPRIALQAAVERNLSSYQRAMASLLASVGLAEVHDDPDAFWFLSDIPIAMLNAVSDLRFRWDEFPARAATIRAAAQARGVPQLWWTGPFSQPLDVGEQLLRMDVLPGDVIGGMIGDLDAIRPLNAIPGLTINLATRAADVDAVKLVIETSVEQHGTALAQIAEALGRCTLDKGCPLQLLVARMDGIPVAAAWLTIAEDVAGVYYVVVHPDWQRRGIATRLVSAAFHSAQEAGATLGLMLTDKRQTPLALRLGLEECCVVVQFVGPAPEEPATD